MARIIHLDWQQAERLAFSYSPVHEAIHSLLVLNGSGRHPLHLPWVLDIRRRMPPALKTEVSAFGILFTAAIPDIFTEVLPLSGDFPTFDEEFRIMQALSPYDYAERVVYQAIMDQKTAEWGGGFEQIRQSREMRRQVLARTTQLHPASLQMVEELLEQPEQSHQRFLRFFSWYWEVCMAPQWPQLEAALFQDIQQRGQILFEQGVVEVLDSLAPQLHVSRQGEHIVMYSPWHEHIEMHVKDTLFLVPSSYVWPRLAFIYENDALVAIVYSIKRFQDEGSAPVPSERLLKLLRAAGDMTRLQILQLLSQRPRSTRELAGILNLSEAGISKHVKMLQEAGFLKSERSSYYVLYRSVRAPLAEITRGLEGLLPPLSD